MSETIEMSKNEIDQCVRTLALESVRQCEKTMNSISIKVEKLKNVEKLEIMISFDHILIMTTPFMTTKIPFTIYQGDEGVEIVYYVGVCNNTSDYIDEKMFNFNIGFNTITINLEYIREDLIKMYKDIYKYCYDEDDDAHLKQLKHPDFKFENF